MARAANAAAAAAIGMDEAGLHDLTISEQLEPVSMPADAGGPESLSGPLEDDKPGLDHKISAAAEPADSQAITHAVPVAPTTPVPDDLSGSASAAAEASAAAAGAPAPGTAALVDQPMHDASEAAAAPPAPEQTTQACPGLSQAEQPPEQMTQTYPAVSQAVQPPEQSTQAYAAAPMEVEGSRKEEALHDDSMAQQAEQGSAAPEAQDAAPALQPDGKPLVAGSAIFTKVSPMKAKVGS